MGSHRKCDGKTGRKKEKKNMKCEASDIKELDFIFAIDMRSSKLTTTSSKDEMAAAEEASFKSPSYLRKIKTLRRSRIKA